MEEFTEEDLMPEVGDGKIGHGGRSMRWDGALGFTKAQALQLLGEVLYAYKMPDGLIKIGHTKQLNVRSYRYTNAELLAVHLGNQSDETAVHRLLQAHAAHGREYYNPAPEVLAVVNAWRRGLGLESI